MTRAFQSNPFQSPGGSPEHDIAIAGAGHDFSFLILDIQNINNKKMI